MISDREKSSEVVRVVVASKHVLSSDITSRQETLIHAIVFVQPALSAVSALQRCSERFKPKKSERDTLNFKHFQSHCFATSRNTQKFPIKFSAFAGIRLVFIRQPCCKVFPLQVSGDQVLCAIFNCILKSNKQKEKSFGKLTQSEVTRKFDYVVQSCERKAKFRG